MRELVVEGVVGKGEGTVSRARSVSACAGLAICSDVQYNDLMISHFC